MNTVQILMHQQFEIEKHIDRIQAHCMHPSKTSKYGGNTGNYDPSSDSYWCDHYCPDCEKKWREYL